MLLVLSFLEVYISIHALREEGDSYRRGIIEPPRNFYPRPPRGGRQLIWIRNNIEVKFLSTPSARRATSNGKADSSSEWISIHALREEGDGLWPRPAL